MSLSLSNSKSGQIGTSIDKWKMCTIINLHSTYHLFIVNLFFGLIVLKRSEAHQVVLAPHVPLDGSLFLPDNNEAF